jgi:hypothetical protein
MIQLILLLALVGFIVFLLTTYIPMPPIFKTCIYVLVAVCLLLYLLQVFGVGDVPLPRLH